MKQANSVDAFLRILDQYKSDSEQYYRGQLEKYTTIPPSIEIGRASCRERV